MELVFRMVFNLQKVLKALLFSSGTPLSIKDIQLAITRFHEQAALPPAPVAAAEGGVDKGGDGAADVTAAVTPAGLPAETIEVPVETFEDPELYQDVPSLVTAAQIREAMDAIAADFKAANDSFLLVEGSNGWRLVTHPRFARWVRILRDEPPPVRLSQSALETLAIVAYRQPVTRTEIETIRGVSAEAGINKLLERELIYIVGRADLPGRPIQYGTTDEFFEFVGIKSIDELPASDVLSTRQIDEWLKNATAPKQLGDTEMGLANESGQLPLAAGAEAGGLSQTPAAPPPESLVDIGVATSEGMAGPA
jgi:segregation and condensation protein B